MYFQLKTLTVDFESRKLSEILAIEKRKISVLSKLCRKDRKSKKKEGAKRAH